MSDNTGIAFNLSAKSMIFSIHDIAILKFAVVISASAVTNESSTAHKYPNNPTSSNNVLALNL